MPSRTQYIQDFFNFALEENFLTIFLMIAFTIFLIYLIYDERRNEQALPALPRPWRLPIIGNLHQFGSSPWPHETLTKFGRTFGGVFAIRLGSWDVLVINSLSAAREALFQKGAHFSSRPPFFTLRLGQSNEHTAAFGDYTPAQIQRKKALLQAFHRVILTQPEHLNAMVVEEAARMSRILQATGGSPFDPRACLKMVVSRMVYRLTFGGNVGPDEEHDLYNLSKTAREFQDSTGLVLLTDFMPWMKFAVRRQMKELEDLVGVLLGFVRAAYRRRKEQNILERQDYCTAKNIENFIKTIKRHEKLSERDSLETPHENKPYLEEESSKECIVSTKYEMGINESEKMDEKKDDFTPEDEKDIEKRVVQMISADAFGAGQENTSHLFAWSVAYIASHRELQNDLQAEIDQVIGVDSPCVEHKQKMPLMQATILETLRLSCVIPMGIPHYCIQDSVVNGYHVAKGTVVLTNIWGINHDDRHFSHPECFEPYRFLDHKGQLRADRCSLMIPFNIGPRTCAGNAVTKTIMFLLLSSLLQKFELETEKDLADLRPIPGPLLAPDFYEVVFHPRENKSNK